MKKEQLSDALGQIPDDLLLEADHKRKKKRNIWISLTAMAACFALILGLAVPAFRQADPVGEPLGTEKPPIFMNSSDPKILHSPVYPSLAPYPAESFLDWEAYSVQNEAWQEDRDITKKAGSVSDSAVDAFAEATIPTFLMGAETENRVYSPVNIYLALSMLAELTDGNSRAQILELLEVEDIESLRSQAQNVWRANYSDDGALTSILANSLWLDENIEYKDETMARLAELYYAASHQGVMGSDAYNALLQQWLKENTGGRLDAQAEEVELDPMCVLALASTVYYQGCWADQFSKHRTCEDVFYSPSGEQTVTYMAKDIEDEIYWGENYTAVYQPMETGGGMWLILPDEGISVDEVLAQGEALAMTQRDDWDNSKTVSIHLKMPKFDVVSQMDLIEGMKALGVSDVFDHTVSDFSPTTDQFDELYVSQINHAARVTVDEEGCTAAAFTVIEVDSLGAWISGDEIWFTLDRPFLFVLTGVSGQPLFTGVVNDPC